MTFRFPASAFAASLAAALAIGPAANAADLGSLKDGYAPVSIAPAVGPCYVRGDVGYSMSSTPEVSWPVTYDSEYITDNVSNVSIENTWLAEGGIGCGSGSRGFRGELMLGYRGERKIDGEPYPWYPVDNEPPVDDPLHTSVTTYTAMFNAYYDFGVFRGFQPYVGAGIGLAYHMVDDVYFTENPFLLNEIHGDNDVAFAWSVMAGVGYQLSSRTIIDLGYRYIDLGRANSERHDNAGFVNPRVMIDDIAAHELKLGLRYHFGG